MPLYLGETKCHLYHGDQHPASLYLGDRLITGYKILKATGTGRVELGTQPYKASLPSVTVHGEGKQDKLEGYNILNLLSGGQPPADSGIIITHDKIVIKKNFSGWANRTGYVTNDLYNSGKPQWNLSCKVTGEFTGRVYGIFGFSMFNRDVVDGKYIREEDYHGTYPDKLGVDISPSYLTILSDELVISDIMITMPDKGFPPYEPYCGGIPAPNPQYPIDPVFLEGASVVGRGKNLLDFLKLHDEGNKAGYSMDAKNGRVFVDSVRPYMPIRFNVSVPANSEITLSIDYIYSRDNIVQISNYGLGGTKVNKTRFTAGSTTLNTYEHSMLVVSCYTSEQTSFDARGIRVTIGSTPTPYEPYYDGGTAPLPILRALPDGSVRDEIDVVSGTVVRRISEPWECTYAYNANDNTAFTRVPNNWINDWHFQPICSHIQDVAKADAIYIPWTKGLDAFNKFIDDQKAAGTPVTIWYALETPIIEHYDPAILRQHPGYTQLIQQGGEFQAPIDVEYYKEAKE